MTKTDITRAALALPAEDQLELAQTLWDNVSPQEDYVLSPEIKALLGERLEDARRNPDDQYTVEETLAEIDRQIAEVG